MKINEIKKVNESKIYKIIYHAHVKMPSIWSNSGPQHQDK